MGHNVRYIQVTGDDSMPPIHTTHIRYPTGTTLINSIDMLKCRRVAV